MTLSIGTRLGSYEITAQIGVGGMGEVYRATDTRLGRDVAVKVLPEDLADNEERLARFNREARLLASLNNPNVATLYGFESEDETRFLVMELVEGDTLEERIARGPIPVEEALPLFVQIAQGLEAAHEKGIIHRDLKPANIKLSEDRVKVLDFGLAKAVEPGGPDGVLSQSTTLTAAVTRSGEILGTAAYMSPEQARGKPVDKRTDIWAFGVCLFEALSGRRTFEGSSGQETVAKILMGEPDWTALPTSTPEALRRVLRRCLEKDPGQRPATLAEVRSEVEAVQRARNGFRFVNPLPALTPRLSIALVLLVTAIAGSGWWRLRQSPRAPSVEKIKLAVLPLENLSGDPEQEYFIDGMTEELIAQLGRLRPERLGVIARTSAMYYKGKDKRGDEIARELRVDYLLEGSVRLAGNRVRVTAQLIQVSDQTHLWAETYERDLEDIFALQSDVAQRVSRSLALELLPADLARAQRSPPADTEAYDAYLRGRHLETRGDLEGAIEHYQEAIEKDPDWALPYAALGHDYDMLAMADRIPTVEGDRKAREYTLRAFRLDPTLPEVQVNLADFSFYQDWKWSEGEAGFRDAFEADPNSESAVFHYAGCLAYLGRHERAVEVLERGLELNPHSTQLNGTLLWLLYQTRRYQRAIELGSRMIDVASGVGDRLGSIYEELGRGAEAVDAYLRARILAGETAEHVQALRDAYDAGGIAGYWRKRLELLREESEAIEPGAFSAIYAHLSEQDRALGWVQDLKETMSTERLSPYFAATFYIEVGDRDRALEKLEEAYRQHSRRLVALTLSRIWDPLRDDPRFHDLIQRMNFPV